MIGVRFDLVPQLGDVDPYIMGILLVVGSPHGAQITGRGSPPSPVERQVPEDLVLRDRQPHFLPPHGYQVAPQVHRHFPVNDHAFVLFPRGAAQGYPYAREKLPHGEGLGNVVVRACVQCLYLIFFSLSHRKDNDRASA